MRRNLTRRGLATASLLVALSLAWSAGAGALDANRLVVRNQGRPYGATYGEWGARWWQWVLSAPVSQSPLLDTTGEDCAYGQSRRNRVWFLAGTSPSVGPVTRTCTVPVGTPLFFPVLNTTFVATEPGETEEQAHAFVTNRVNTYDVSQMAVEVDGMSINNIRAQRAHSPTFFVTLPADNIFGVPAGTYGPAAADGYWIMLHPLRPGPHTIHIHGVFPSGAVLDVTYNLLVTHR